MVHGVTVEPGHMYPELLSLLLKPEAVDMVGFFLGGQSAEISFLVEELAGGGIGQDFISFLDGAELGLGVAGVRIFVRMVFMCKRPESFFDFLV